MLNVGKKVEDKLKKCGLEVKLSRSNDTFKTLEYRSSDANKWGADCFVSLHCNSFNKTAKGLEIYCYKFKYRKLADAIQDEMVNAKLYTVNRGVKEGNYHVIRETNMSAALIELGFIDNSEDINLLLNKQDEFATTIAKGICKYLGVTYIEDKPTLPTNNGQMLAVCIGAYKDRANADKALKEAKEKGFKDVYLIPR